jgi:hypothetical protein
MTQVGFEPTISPPEREKTVHALDLATTMIGCGTENSKENEHGTMKTKRKTVYLHYVFNKIILVYMCDIPNKCATKTKNSVLRIK